MSNKIVADAAEGIDNKQMDIYLTDVAKRHPKFMEQLNSKEAFMEAMAQLGSYVLNPDNSYTYGWCGEPIVTFYPVESDTTDDGLKIVFTQKYKLLQGEDTCQS